MGAAPAGQTHMNRHQEERCDLPYIKTEWLEWAIWGRVKEILNGSDKLAEYVNKALARLEELKAEIGSEALAFDGKLEAIRAKKERLGMVFADGAISESIYRSKLGQLKKQEAAVLKRRHNIDPEALADLAELEARIAKVKDILGRGSLYVTEFGMFAEIGDEYVPAGFNAWRECDGELAIGETTEMDTFRIEGTDKVMRGVNAPAGFWDCQDQEEQAKRIKKNMRAILQLFDIKVIVFPERVEIRGAIPTQVLDRIIDKEKPATAPVNTSPSPLLERGK